MCQKIDGTNSDKIRSDGETGMRVELPKLLSVLAHELRSPLGVIQGYLRLLKSQRGEQDPDAKMIKAMLDATGRLTMLGRQASDLSSWMTRNKAGVPANHVALPALLADVSGRVAGPLDTAAVSDAAAAARVRSPEPEMLAAAIAALVDNVARETGEPAAPVAVVADRDADAETVSLFIGPPSDVDGARASADAANAEVAFDGGGLGLALVLASYVLDAHEARVTSAGSNGVIQVRLYTEGAAA